MLRRVVDPEDNNSAKACTCHGATKGLRSDPWGSEWRKRTKKSLQLSAGKERSTLAKGSHLVKWQRKWIPVDAGKPRWIPQFGIHESTSGCQTSYTWSRRLQCYLYLHIHPAQAVEHLPHSTFSLDMPAPTFFARSVTELIALREREYRRTPLAACAHGNPRV